MSLSETSYAQPEKDSVRQRVIARAVNSLAKERDSSPVVTAQEFERTMEYCLGFLEQHCDANLRAGVRPAAEDWHTLHQSRVGIKKPDDLHVLFLAGPDPIADLMAFKQAGVPFTNIWAIERDPDTFRKAVSILGREGIPLKVHNGNLQQFFSIVPQQFDIVYFDACGQLFGGSPNTINVLRELFVNQRLAPLSVLITNFCEPCPKLNRKVLDRTLLRSLIRRSPKALAKIANAGNNPDLGITDGKLDEPSPEEREIFKWGRQIGLWSYAHGDNDTWTQNFDEFIETEVLPELLKHYSRFTTEFIVQFAGQLLPWWRVVALPGSRREYFNNEEALAKAVAESGKVVEAWTNPLYSALRHVFFTESSLEKSAALHEFYFKETLGERKVKLGDAAKTVSLIRTFLESEWGDAFFQTKHIQDACSPQLVKVLRNFKWFDEGKRAFCYDPLPHLLTDLLTGLYGYPYHANTRKLDRIAYQAKDTVMFTDVFVLDQARYLYDLLPTLPFFEEAFPIPQQLVLRVCMDAIRRHSHFGCSDLFYMSDLAASGEAGFKYWPPPDRESIGCPNIEGEDVPPLTTESPL
jgi:hypothetical protein